jgi:hypothetical protein
MRVQVERELEERLLGIGQTIAQNLASSRPASSGVADSIGQFSIRADLLRIAEASDLGRIEVIDPERRHLVGTDETIPFGEEPLFEAQPECGGRACRHSGGDALSTDA